MSIYWFGAPQINLLPATGRLCCCHIEICSSRIATRHSVSRRPLCAGSCIHCDQPCVKTEWFSLWRHCWCWSLYASALKCDVTWWGDKEKHWRKKWVGISTNTGQSQHLLSWFPWLLRALSIQFIIVTVCVFTHRIIVFKCHLLTSHYKYIYIYIYESVCAQESHQHEQLRHILFNGWSETVKISSSHSCST